VSFLFSTIAILTLTGNFSHGIGTVGALSIFGATVMGVTEGDAPKSPRVGVVVGGVSGVDDAEDDVPGVTAGAETKRHAPFYSKLF